MKTETERWIEQWLALATGRMIVWQTKWKRKKFFFYCLAARSSSLVFCSALTHNIQVAHLAFHWIRIYLAHVPGKRRKKRGASQDGNASWFVFRWYLPALVRFFNISDAHCPGLVLWVGNADPLVLGYHMVLYRENRLCIDAQPRNLCGKSDSNTGRYKGCLMKGSLRVRMSFNMGMGMWQKTQLSWLIWNRTAAPQLKV